MAKRDGNLRVRIEPHIASYLCIHVERVLGRPIDEENRTADLGIVANQLLYEHRLSTQLVKQLPLTRFFNWLMGALPGGGKVVALNALNQTEASALEPSRQEPLLLEDELDLDFESALAEQFQAEQSNQAA